MAVFRRFPFASILARGYCPHLINAAHAYQARFITWWLHVETDDPVRQTLNVGIARLSLFAALLSLAAAFPLGLLDRPVFGLLSLAYVPFCVLTWALGRCGGVWGARLQSLVLMGVILYALDPVEEASRPGIGVNLLLVIPVMYAAVFVRPSAAWWFGAAETLVVGWRLLIIGHPAAMRYLVLLVFDLGFVTSLIVFAATTLYTLLGQMGQVVAARTEELNEALGIQKRLNDGRVTLMQDIAHDLNNRLATLSGNLAILQVVLEDSAAGRPVAASEQPEQVVARLGEALRAATRYSRLIRDAALLERGEFPLRMEAFDIASLTQGVATSFVDSFRYAGIALVITEPHHQASLVLADRDLCQRVIENFLVNALRFAHASQPDQQVSVSVTVVEDRVEVAVRDAGRGVSPERLAELGQRFIQLHRGEVVEGRGMGLSFCARALRAMGGELRFASSGENEGATATMLLPIGPTTPTLRFPDEE